MKKVVERVQRENDTLKKSSAPANQGKVAALEQENEKLKVVDHTMSYVYILCILLYIKLSLLTYLFCYYNWP